MKSPSPVSKLCRLSFKESNMAHTRLIDQDVEKVVESIMQWIRIYVSAGKA